MCLSGIISCFIISNGFTALAVASVPGATGQECVCLCACGYSPRDHCASLRVSGILPRIDPSIYSRHTKENPRNRLPPVVLISPFQSFVSGHGEDLLQDTSEESVGCS